MVAWRLGLAIVVRVPLGVLIGRSRIAADLTNPSLQFLRAIPGPALVPVFISYSAQKR